MTTTDPTTGPAATAPPPVRRLRRSTTDRIGAGVAGGLAEYFGLDPVLFRVLFATSAFFGGAGVLAYLLAWVAIPEQGTDHAPIDRVVAAVRYRRGPALAALFVGAALLWALAFSWWAPGPLFPVMLLLVLAIVVFARRGPSATAPAAVSLEKDTAADTTWVDDRRRWLDESRAASRARRRRAAPVRWVVLGVLAATVTVLALVDAATGIPLPVYAWAAIGIVGTGLLVGVLLRRAPWSLALLLPPAVLAVFAFGNTSASLHDGFGQRTWAPTRASSIADEYRLAFGQAVLDLRGIDTLDGPRDIDVVAAAGQVKVLLPATMNATVHADVRIGAITVDGDQVAESGDVGPGSHSHDNRGMSVGHVVEPPAGASGPPLRIDVDLADGEVVVERG